MSTTSTLAFEQWCMCAVCLFDFCILHSNALSVPQMCPTPQLRAEETEGGLPIKEIYSHTFMFIFQLHPLFLHEKII